MRGKREQFKQDKLLAIVAKCFVVVLFLSIPFIGLVLESFNIFFISFEMMFGFYLLTILVCLLAKQWKLALIAAFGSLVIYSITLGISEVLWYYLKEFYNIDISPRR